MTDARYVIHDRRMVGSAVQLKRLGNGEIAIDDGRMTYCSPEDPEWILYADELEIDPVSGDAQAWGAKLKVADVPVMYLPWIRFPVDSRRKTGVLFPDMAVIRGVALILRHRSTSTWHPTTTYSTALGTFRSAASSIKENSAG